MAKNEFFYLKEGFVCPRCKSDGVYGIGHSRYSGYIVKCSDCGNVFLEKDMVKKKGEISEDSKNR